MKVDPVFQIYNENEQLNRTFKFALLIVSIAFIVMIFTINWKIFYVWNALPEKYQKQGLTGGDEVSAHFYAILWYWCIHFSPIHLCYVLMLFGLGLTGRDISKNQVILLIFSIFMVPVLTWIVSFGLANLLAYFGKEYMLNTLSTSYYIGASAVAWSVIGISKRFDILVVVAFLFPFTYKLVVSHVYDFTPDIAHFMGYTLGIVISGIKSN